MATRVVHCKRSSYDVYIGRGRCPQTGEMGQWGNPFKLTDREPRGATIERYRAWLWLEIRTGARSIEELAELHGKTLACWCAPQPCHGDVLARAAAWAHEQLAAREAERVQAAYEHTLDQAAALNLAQLKPSAR